MGTNLRSIMDCLGNIKILLRLVIFLYPLLAMTACETTSYMQTERMAVRQEFSAFKEYRLVSGDVLDINYLFGISSSEYRINKGDRLLIYFPGASSVRSEQVVRPDGAVTLPAAGDIFVAGKTTQDASSTISHAMRDYLHNSSVTVQVTQASSALEDAIVTPGRGSSKQYTVRPDGTLTLPGLGSIKARGKSIETLTAEINSRYQENWPSAKVDINLQESQGMLVYLLGEVRNPGAYRLYRPSVFPEAVSLAGGLTNDASLSDVVIARLDNEVYSVSRVNLKSDFTDSRTGRMYPIGPNDIIYVPKTALAEIAYVIREITSIFQFNGWGLGFNYRLDNEGN